MATSDIVTYYLGKRRMRKAVTDFAGPRKECDSLEQVTLPAIRRAEDQFSAFCRKSSEVNSEPRFAVLLRLKRSLKCSCDDLLAGLD
jgi:hypothetical protein